MGRVSIWRHKSGLSVMAGKAGSGMLLGDAIRGEEHVELVDRRSCADGIGVGTGEKDRPCHI